uniref:ARAD1D18392p n=1 Tax=Blastobotrys adeninivorans TaxID=409370 RepID=A0A060TFY0_BLAAD
MAKEQLSFLIIGAGLGGLAAAIGLTRAGHKVTVLEQAPQIGEIGAGIQIPPNSSRILTQWGLRDKFLKYSILPEDLNLRSYHDGTILSTQALNTYLEDTYGFPYWHIHRADFHKVLYEATIELGVPMKLGERVEEADFENNAVITSKGNRYTADVIIGCDGVRSKCRSLMGSLGEVVNTGDLAYRMLIHSSKLKGNSDVEFLLKPNLNFWMGPHMHCVVYLLHDGEQCNVVVLAPDDLPDDVNVQPASVEELRNLFKDWDPRFQTLISLVDSTSKWRLQNFNELPNWVHPTANFALLGDACHATLPYLAQGAAQAVEDAAVLSSLFEHVECRGQVHDLLDIYEKLRKSRTTAVVQNSTDLGQNVFHLVDGPRQQERDRILTETAPHQGYPNKFADPVFQKFLYGYNAFEEAENAWRDYKKVETQRL